MVDMKDLHPWRVIDSYLFDLESDLVCKIIGLTGLQVDLSLTKEEAYSHKTRNRALLPRVQAAYDSLSDDDKMRVAWIVANEVAKISDYEQKLNDSLRSIGWKLESGKLTTEDSTIQEMFFHKGSQHDAYIGIKTIIKQGSKSITIIDPYIDGTISPVLSTVTSGSLSIQLLSSKLPGDFILEAQKFLKQHSHFTLEVKTTTEVHDRFIIIDDSKCFCIGASIKDAGNKAFMISEIEDGNNTKALKDQFDQSWTGATDIKI